MASAVALVACCCGVLVALGLLKAVRYTLGCLRAKQQYKTFPVPGPPLPASLLGHVPDLLSHKGPWTFLDWSNKYGRIFKVQFANGLGVVLSDPSTILRITRKTGPGPYCPKPHETYAAFDAMGGPNILSSGDDPYWRAVRQSTAPCFSMSNLKQVVPLVLELTQRAADRMAQHATFDVTDAAKRITSDVMVQLLYDEDLRATFWEPSEYLDTFYPLIKAQGTVMSNPVYMYRLWDPEVRFARRCMALHNSTMMETVKRLRRQPPPAHTIAAHILSAIDPATGKPLSDKQAKAEIAIFMAAGFETTSHAITWSLALLASHPDVQDEVHAELQEAGLAAAGGAASSTSRAFEPSDLGRLPLLSAVIKEALRVCPPAPFGGFRQVVQEEGTELCGYHVPKGTHILLPEFPFSMAQHNYGADALLLRPQRWMPSAATDSGRPVSTDPASHGAIAERLDAAKPAAREPASQGDSTGATAAPPEPIPFLTGPRDCIGQTLAKLELQVVLATLLSRFRFSPGPELERELQLAAATGQPVVSAVHNLAGAFITLQPLSGQMVLRIDARV